MPVSWNIAGGMEPTSQRYLTGHITCILVCTRVHVPVLLLYTAVLLYLAVGLLSVYHQQHSFLLPVRLSP